MVVWYYSYRMKPRCALHTEMAALTMHAQGVAQAIKGCNFTTLAIPNWSEQMESLNVAVAGSILMYDLKRANG